MGFNQTLLVKGGSASKFTDLTDTFPNYTGKAGQVITVKGDETGLTSVSMSGASFDKLSVYLGAAFSSVANAWQKFPLDTVNYDTGGIWDNVNKRVQPKKAGYYQVSGRARTTSIIELILQITGPSGGATAIGIGGDSTNSKAVGGAGLIYCNGTTDYIELWVFTSAIAAFTVGTFDSHMEIVGPF